MMMMTVQERVRALRERKGMSISAISALAGVGSNTWLNLERYGIIPKRPETRRKIAEVLGVDESELFPNSEE